MSRQQVRRYRGRARPRRRRRSLRWLLLLLLLLRGSVRPSGPDRSGTDTLVGIELRRWTIPVTCLTGSFRATAPAATTASTSVEDRVVGFFLGLDGRQVALVRAVAPRGGLLGNRGRRNRLDRRVGRRSGRRGGSGALLLMLLLRLLVMLLLFVGDPETHHRTGIREDRVGRRTVRARRVATLLSASSSTSAIAAAAAAASTGPTERVSRRPWTRTAQQVLARHSDHGAARRARHVCLRRQGRGVGHALPWSRKVYGWRCVRRLVPLRRACWSEGYRGVWEIRRWFYIYIWTVRAKSLQRGTVFFSLLSWIEAQGWNVRLLLAPILFNMNIKIWKEYAPNEIRIKLHYFVSNLCFYMKTVWYQYFKYLQIQITKIFFF